MTEKLEKYLKKEINYAIYEQLKKYKIPKIEKHLDYFYDILGYLENNINDPQAAFSYITDKWENEGHEYKIKYLYSDIMYNLMTSKKYEEWQLKKIQQYFKEYNTKLKKDKKAKEGKEQFNRSLNFLKNSLEKLNEGKTKHKKERDTEFNELLEKLNIERDTEKVKPEPIILPFDEKTNTKIIKLIYEKLSDAELIGNSFTEFKAHFIASDSPIVKIDWKGKKHEMKAFVDLLIVICKLHYIKHPNILLEQHFTSEEYITTRRSFSSLRSKNSYLKIVDLKVSNHPLSKLFKKIKSIVSDIDLY